MIGFYLAPWFLVPFGLQLLLLRASRDRMRPLRFVLLIPLGLLVPFALLGLGEMFAASWMPEGDGLIGLFTGLVELNFLLALLPVLLPVFLLLAVLFFLGWALAWEVFDLWERGRNGGAPD